MKTSRYQAYYYYEPANAVKDTGLLLLVWNSHTLAKEHASG